MLNVTTNKQIKMRRLFNELTLLASLIMFIGNPCVKFDISGILISAVESPDDVLTPLILKSNNPKSPLS